MAKRKKKTEAAPPVDHNALADAVASMVELRNIFLMSSHSGRADNIQNIEEHEVTLGTKRIGFGPLDNLENHFIVKPTFQAVVPSAIEGGDPLFYLEATFGLIYEVANFKALTKEQLMAFTKREGIHHVWPFWRELLVSTTVKMALPPLVLPVHRTDLLPRTPSGSTPPDTAPPA